MKMLADFITGFKKGMKQFSQNISVIVNTALLGFVYIVGVGITSAFAKLYKKRFLDMKHHEGTYWSEMNLKKKHIDEYLKQF